MDVVSNARVGRDNRQLCLKLSRGASLPPRKIPIALDSELPRLDARGTRTQDVQINLVCMDQARELRPWRCNPFDIVPIDPDEGIPASAFAAGPRLLNCVERFRRVESSW